MVFHPLYFALVWALKVFRLFHYFQYLEKAHGEWRGNICCGFIWIIFPTNWTGFMRTWENISTIFFDIENVYISIAIRNGFKYQAPENKIHRYRYCRLIIHYRLPTVNRRKSFRHGLWKAIYMKIIRTPCNTVAYCCMLDTLY